MLLLTATEMGCAHRIGNNATEAALQTLKEDMKKVDPAHAPARVAAERAVVGALETLDSPEQRAHIQRVVSEAVTAALLAAAGNVSAGAAGKGSGAARPHRDSPMEQLVHQAARAAVDSATERALAALGPDGTGPLGLSLSRTGRRLADEALGGATDRLAVLLPGCPPGQEAACLQEQVNQLARAAASGLSTGLRQTIGWPLLLVAFLGGAVIAALVTWLWLVWSRVGRGLRTRPA